MDTLKTESALAIWRLTGDSPATALVDILKRRTRDIADSSRQSDLHQISWEAYWLALDALEEADIEAALNALMSLLDSEDPDISTRAAGELRRITGQQYGPYDDTPLVTIRTDARKWAPWWFKRRDEVLKRIRAGDTLPTESAPPPVTVRDYLLESITQRWSGDVPPPVDRNPARIWLEAHASQHLDEFRRIATDQTERSRIRQAALEHFAELDPDHASDELKGILLETTACFKGRLQSKALDLLQQRHSEKLDKALSACLDNEPCAPAAVEYLCAFGGREILTAKLQDLPSRIRDTALDQLLNHPTFGAMEMALAGDNPEFASRAIRETRHPSILPGLSQGALRRLEFWRHNSWCQFWILYRTPRSELGEEDFVVAMAAQDGVEPPAPAVFATVYRRTFNRHALDEFVRCVDAYRKSRGRSDPLKTFDFAWMH